jgi:cytosine/adenosine deaminase-related metal-dependent hydrolase
VLSHKQVIKAAWIAPMDRPPIRDAAVAFEHGKILAVGETKKILAAHPDAQIRDLGNSILLPGLINAHTHLELSECSSAGGPGESFAHWILSLPQRCGNTNGVDRGIEQSLKFGVTCVADITHFPDATRSAIARSPLRCISFGEIVGMAKRRSQIDLLMPAATDSHHATEKLRIGISPHAPYSLDLPGYEQCIKIAKEKKLPLMTHLSENFAEREFLEHHSGEFRWFWEQFGFWEEPVETYRGSPIAMAQAIGMLEISAILAHVNYCDDLELDLLARGKASVVYCPRTHAYFGHPPHRWREMLARGINVAVGTDSCASSPDLNLVDDLRLLRKIAPEISAEEIWKLATIRAASALSMQNEIGSISPGKFADFVSFDGNENNPIEEILRNHQIPTSAWIAGIKLDL